MEAPPTGVCLGYAHRHDSVPPTVPVTALVSTSGVSTAPDPNMSHSLPPEPLPRGTVGTPLPAEADGQGALSQTSTLSRADSIQSLRVQACPRNPAKCPRIRIPKPRSAVRNPRSDAAVRRGGFCNEPGQTGGSLQPGHDSCPTGPAALSAVVPTASRAHFRGTSPSEVCKCWAHLHAMARRIARCRRCLRCRDLRRR